MAWNRHPGSINVTDGTLIWKLSNYMMFIGTPPAIADSYLVTASDYDNLIYCIGPGPSATTVQAPAGCLPTLGSSVMITGTVTDQSPGAKADGPKYGYTDGIPAVSVADQEAWMEYIYEEQSMPTTATGVPVTLTAIDPNGNTINIGTVNTTTTTGAYGLMFTPQIQALIISSQLSQDPQPTEPQERRYLHGRSFSACSYFRTNTYSSINRRHILYANERRHNRFSHHSPRSSTTVNT